VDHCSACAFCVATGRPPAAEPGTSNAHQRRVTHRADRPHITKENIMSIVRWDPFRELQDMNERLNRMFGGSPLARDKDKDALVAFDWAPSVDISESTEEYVIKAELPGVNKEDVKVAIEDGVVRIQGERKQEKEEKDKKFHRVERSYGSFMRTFALPVNIDETKVQAQFKDGVLAVRLPKSPIARPKALDVKVS
jgi:HSP20 family protein